MTQSLLKVEDLSVDFSTRRGIVNAVRGLSFELKSGATLGIVGESGSGKSVTAYAVTRLLDASGRITGGKILFNGHDLLRATERDMQALRGAAISMVFQNPRAALNPIRSIGMQLMDALAAHVSLTYAERRERALDLLRSVLMHEPEKRFDAYPHELSGGMCQRAMIAAAIACEPALLIADEPTTGLDVTTQKTVMDLLARLTAERGMGLILITHDLGLAAQYCGDVAVMQRGQIVEHADAGHLFRQPQHPYTRKLVAASPTPTSTIDDLVAEGEPLIKAPKRIHTSSTPLLQVRNLIKTFEVAQIGPVSFEVSAGESVGLVGESGSGKSTISRMICRLLDHASGEILFNERDIGNIPANKFHANPMRREIQIVFQDPHDSLNPRFNAFDCIAHPLRRLSGLKDGAALRARVEECAHRAGLPVELLSRFPHQLSGGQKARVGIARAISVKPRLLVLDEPTAALDVSVQAVILKLLNDLRRKEELAFVFVSHDLNVVRMMCDRTIVLRHGRIVEEGDSHTLFAAPESPYTRELLDAIPHFVPNHAAAQ